jgi:hypothetical protein
MRLRWRKPPAAIVTRWRGPGGAMVVAEEPGPGPMAALIGPPGPPGPVGDLEGAVIDGGTFN